MFGPSNLSGVPGPRDVERTKPKASRRIGAATGAESDRELIDTVESTDSVELSKRLAGEGQEEAADDRRRHAPPPTPKPDDEKPHIDLSA